MAHSGPGKLSAVDAILAEAADLVALEPIAKLNTASLAHDDSALPSTLESRFRKLKSLPAAPAPVKTLGRSASTLLHPPQPNPAPPAPTPSATQEEQQPREDADNTSPPPQRPVRDDHDDEDLFGGSGGAGRGRPMLRERNRGRDDDSSTSPRQACCLFGFSPKKPPPPTKGKKGPAADRGVDADQWGDENRPRVVTELKEQQRQLKKALQEQVRVSRETAGSSTRPRA